MAQQAQAQQGYVQYPSQPAQYVYYPQQPYGLVYIWPRLLKRWIALSTEKITIQRISITEINYVIRWIVIYPVDSAIRRLNNQILVARP